MKRFAATPLHRWIAGLAVSMLACVPVPYRVYPRQTVAATCPYFFVEFTNEIDPAVVLSRATLTVDGNIVPLIQMNAAEIDADANLRFIALRSKPRRWVAFRASRNLPPHGKAQLQIAGREYKLGVSEELHVLGIECLETDADGRCFANQHWRIRFSNPIARFEKSVSLAPAVRELWVESDRDRLDVHNAFDPMAAHEVTVSTEIRDIYGQTLDRDWKGEVRFGHGQPAEWLYLPNFQILAPGSKPVLRLFSINELEDVNVSITPVRLDEWPEADDSRSRQITLSRRHAAIDTIVESDIDLATELGHGPGTVKVVVNGREGIVQRTDLALDAFLGKSRMSAFVTSLSTGRPIKGATVGFLPFGPSSETDENGLAEVWIPDSRGGAIAASLGKDSVVIRSDRTWAAKAAPPVRPFELYLFTDDSVPVEGAPFRGHARAWLLEAAQGTNPHTATQDSRGLTWAFRCGHGPELATDEVHLNSDGSFDVDVDTAREEVHGNCYVVLSESVPGERSSTPTHRAVTGTTWLPSETDSMFRKDEPAIGPRLVADPFGDRVGVVPAEAVRIHLAAPFRPAFGALEISNDESALYPIALPTGSGDVPVDLAPYDGGSVRIRALFTGPDEQHGAIAQRNFRSDGRAIQVRLPRASIRFTTGAAQIAGHLRNIEVQVVGADGRPASHANLTLRVVADESARCLLRVPGSRLNQAVMFTRVISSSASVSDVIEKEFLQHASGMYFGRVFTDGVLPRTTEDEDWLRAEPVSAPSPTQTRKTPKIKPARERKPIRFSRDLQTDDHGEITLAFEAKRSGTFVVEAVATTTSGTLAVGGFAFTME